MMVVQRSTQSLENHLCLARLAVPKLKFSKEYIQRVTKPIPKKEPGKKEETFDGGPVSAKARNWISPVLRNLWKESDVQSRYARLEDLHRLPRHSPRQKPEPDIMKQHPTCLANLNLSI